MAFGYFRTIWITLRAANYTGRAFQDTISHLTKTEQAQARFAMNAQRNLMGVGTMYLAFGGIAVGVLARIMNASKLGQRMMEQFGERINKSISKLGDTLARILRPFLEFITSLLEVAIAIPAFKELLVVGMLLVTAFLLLKGMGMALSGVLGMLSVQLNYSATAGMNATQSLYVWSYGARTATFASLGLAGALKLVVQGFTAGMALALLFASIFGKTIGIIVAVTAALIALAIAIMLVRTAGGDFTAAAGFAVATAIGLGAGAAVLATTEEYQMGTSFVKRGGLARVHAGEEITSARESKVTSRWDTRQPYNKSITNITVSMGDVHTRADEETMFPMIKRAIKDSLDNK